jgi:hypothetical protein
MRLVIRRQQRGTPTVVVRALASAVALLSGSICMVSFAPFAGAAASPLIWGAPAQVDHQPPYGIHNPLQGVSCPSISLCVAIDQEGDVVTSTDPTGGAATWVIADVEGTDRFTGISCPRHHCVSRWTMRATW